MWFTSFPSSQWHCEVDGVGYNFTAKDDNGQNREGDERVNGVLKEGCYMSANVLSTFTQYTRHSNSGRSVMPIYTWRH